MNMFGKVVDYLTYLQKFDKFDAIQQQVKFYPSNFPKYKKYLADLSEYLFSFHARTSPLVDIAVVLTHLSTPTYRCFLLCPFLC